MDTVKEDGLMGIIAREFGRLREECYLGHDAEKLVEMIEALQATCNLLYQKGTFDDSYKQKKINKRFYNSIIDFINYDSELGESTNRAVVSSLCKRVIDAQDSVS